MLPVTEQWEAAFHAEGFINSMKNSQGEKEKSFDIAARILRWIGGNIYIYLDSCVMWTVNSVHNGGNNKCVRIKHEFLHW